MRAGRPGRRSGRRQQCHASRRGCPRTPPSPQPMPHPLLTATSNVSLLSHTRRQSSARNGSATTTPTPAGVSARSFRGSIAVMFRNPPFVAGDSCAHAQRHLVRCFPNVWWLSPFPATRLQYNFGWIRIIRGEVGETPEDDGHPPCRAKPWLHPLRLPPPLDSPSPTATDVSWPRAAAWSLLSW